MELTLPLPKEKTQLTDSSESGWRLNIFSDGGVLLAAVPLKKVRDDGYQLFLRGEGVAIANGFLKQGIVVSPTGDTYGPVPYYLRESGANLDLDKDNWFYTNTFLVLLGATIDTGEIRIRWNA